MLEHFPADLTLVHAYGPEALALSDRALADPMLLGEVQQKEQELLKVFAAENFRDHRSEQHVEAGDAGIVVDKLVKASRADLVMLSTRGRGPLRRLLLGSVTAKILHDADCAIWTATGTAMKEHAPRLPYHSILCAVGEAEEAEAALQCAILFKKAYSAKVSVLHAVEPPPAAFETDYGGMWKDLCDASDLALRNLQAKVGLDAPRTVEIGIVSDRVHAEAARVKADLIITGRGRIQGRLSRIWSHLYAIVRDSPCPVLSV
jgi:nucleotide-binding universal stress UspA family protein